MKVALVYDRVNKWGGAERVLLALHKIWPAAPLYTSVYDRVTAPWAHVFEVRTSFIQKLPFPKNAHEYYPFLRGVAFESFNFDGFDVVISVTQEFAKAVLTKPRTLHICYCLNPVGYLWSGYEDYFAHTSSWFRKLSAPVVSFLRFYDRVAAQRPDSYVAISKVVQERIKKYYGRQSIVVYPPAQLRGDGVIHPVRVKENFFLIVSRLAPQKRLDIAIEAFNKLRWKLVIVGSGREFSRLKAMAKENIEFVGYLTDEQLSRYYNSCRAVVIPGEEDFNLVSVEAQAFGKPVVAYQRGGVAETVTHGETGWFFKEHDAASLVALLQRINIDSVKEKECVANAKRFREQRFEQKFKRFVDQSFMRRQGRY